MQAAPIDYQALYEQMLLEQEKVRLQTQSQIQELEEKLALALFEINKMRRKLFGRSTDNRASSAVDPNQISLFDLGASQEELDAIEAQTRQEVAAGQEQPPQKEAKSTPKKREKGGRMALPADLPRQEVTLHPSQDLTGYSQIGEEVTEVLEITPVSFFVKRIIRTKWARKELSFPEPGLASENVLIAPLPSRTVAKGILGESVLAHLVIGKYVDHLPLYRQIKIIEREGIKLAASTLSDNIAAVCHQLLPLYNCLKREVLANRYLQADESPIKVQDDRSKKEGCHMGYFWAYHAPASKLVLFDYQRGRGQEGPAKLLSTFQGVLQTDGYAVYSSLFENSDRVTLAACMAHVRRKFDEAAAYDKTRAKYAVEQISKLYAIEQQIRESSGLDERAVCQLRLKEASPILDEFKTWLENEYGRTPPKSPLGRAIIYALKLWDRLTVYLYHGQLHIDNNLVENTIRPIALGRKNYLFAGSHEAAQHAAMLYSLLGTCQRNGVPPHRWLEDVLNKLNDPFYEGRFSDLLPSHWKA